MSCENKKTIGVSDCKTLPQYLKGCAITDKDYTMTAADAIDGTAWQTAIADGSVTLFPTWAFSYENISSDAITEESPMSMIEVHPGNYRLKLLFITDIEQHKAIYSWNNTGGRAFLFDAVNQIWGTSQDDGANLKGLLLDRIHVEKLQLNDGTLVSKTVVNLYFIDNTELDLRGENVDGSAFVNGLVTLSGASLVVQGTPTDSELIFTASTVNNNKVIAISGLTQPDINLKDPAGAAQTFTGITESLVTPGLYTIAATATLETGTLDLTIPTLVGPYVTDTSTTVTVV
jgi:hypothetical protein